MPASNQEGYHTQQFKTEKLRYEVVAIFPWPNPMQFSGNKALPSNDWEEQLGVDDPTFTETWSRSSWKVGRAFGSWKEMETVLGLVGIAHVD